MSTIMSIKEILNYEKAKDQTFELSKLGTLADKENLGKKYELVTQCVTSGKSTEEIERLAKLFN